MTNTDKLLMRAKIREAGVFKNPGACVLTDGQFGSTGKGLMAGLLAELFADEVSWVTSNAGPNSGHTSYHEGEKIVLRQLPTFSVVANRMGFKPLTYLNSGAVIDPEVLMTEIKQHRVQPLVSPFAPVVTKHAKNEEEAIVQSVGSTGKGGGYAIAQKVLRSEYSVLAKEVLGRDVAVHDFDLSGMTHAMGLVEVSQGYSLGLNAGFHPYCTSRDCHTAAAMSDAGLHPEYWASGAMVIRTFPIRVAGNSGPCYSDQHELTWDKLGVEPEFTTVTLKQRRVFSFSRKQLAASLKANRPNVLLVNFMNYLNPAIHDEFIIHNVAQVCDRTLGYVPLILLGHGPKSTDVKLWH